MLNIPNFITLIRVFLIPAFIMASLYRRFEIAFIIFTAAALSDALDGFMARKLNQTTKIGVIMDPLADKALIDSAFFILSYLEKVIPPWLTTIVISRDVLLLFGGWLLSTFNKIEKVKPNVLGKLTALSQFLTLFFTLFQLNFNKIPKLFLDYTYLITAALTVASAVSYSLRGIRELNGE